MIDLACMNLDMSFKKNQYNCLNYTGLYFVLVPSKGRFCIFLCA